MSEGVPLRRSPALYAPMLRFGIALHPDADPGTGSGAGAAPAPARRLTGDDAVSLAIAAHRRNPVKIAKVMQAEIDRLNAIIDRGATPAGAVVLQGADAQAWAAYRALGKPEELSALKGERDTLQQAATARTEQEARETLFAEGAAVFGWNEAAARKAARALPVKLERREDEFDVTANGQTTKVKKPVPYVITGEGATAKAERLDAVIARDHDLYLPALRATSTGAGAPVTPATPAAPAIHYPVQSGQGGPATPADPVERRIAARETAAKDRPSPFARARVG